MTRFPALILALALLSLAPSVAADIPPDSELLDQGGSYAAAFDEPGTYTYHCHPHPYMTATIMVTDTPEALDGGINITIKDYAFTPSTVTVRPGTVVTWTNEDPVPHTVTFEREGDGHGHDAGNAAENATAEDHHDMGGMDDHAMGNSSMGDMSDMGNVHNEADADPANGTSAPTEPTAASPTPSPEAETKPVPTPAIALIVGVVAVTALLGLRRA